MDAAVFFRFITVIWVGLCAVDVGRACMCMPAHPQEQLCSNNSYAALVKVRSMEYVYITEKPKYRAPKVSEDIVKIEVPTMVETEHRKDDDGKAFPEEKGTTEENEEPEMERVEVVVGDLGHLSPKHFVASHIRYRVKVYETYRGMKAEEMQGRKMYLYTAPDEGLCGTKLDTKRMYLILGTMDRERLMVTLCDHVIPWTSLDSKQRRAVRRNMRGAQTICDTACEVQTCTWSGCPKPDANSCMWTSDMDLASMKLNIHPANYVCGKDPNVQGGKCVWSEAFGAGKKHRRRRRHHLSARLRRHQADRHDSLP